MKNNAKHQKIILNTSSVFYLPSWKFRLDNYAHHQ